MMQRNKKQDKKESPHSRHNYEDHSNKFLDWVNEMWVERTFLGRFILEADEKYQLRWVSIIFLFCFALSYVLFFQLRLPIDLQVGEKAKIDIVSPINFEMVDETTTEEKRLRAEYSLPDVYDYDPDAFGRVISQVDRAFKQMRILGAELKWPERKQRQEKIALFLSQKKDFDAEIGTVLPDYLYLWLVENHFDMQIENVIIHTLENWYEKKIADLPLNSSTADFFLHVRVVNKSGTGTEFKVSAGEVVNIRNLDMLLLDRTGKSAKFSDVDRGHMLKIAQSLTIPNLQKNLEETNHRRKKIREDVLPVTISYKRNQTIVSRDTIVQPFHMAIVRQVEILQSERRRGFTAVSMAILLGLSVLVFASYIRRFTLNKVKVSAKDLYVMMLISMCVIFFTKVYIFVMGSAFLNRFENVLTPSVLLYSAPVAAGPMLVGLLITSGEVVWLFTAFLSICLGVMEDFNYAFALVSMVGGIAAARGVFKCKARNDIYFAGVRAGIINAIMIVAVFILNHADQESVWRDIMLMAPAGFVGGLVSAMVAMTVIPALESLFNYTTDVKLLELSNLNHPLLKEMIVKAPGTYHHSMMVGSMVEAAAEEIGANPLLGKVMCYYHDIGKLEHAKYFIENQKPGQNPHDHISPFMSKTLLIAHVKDGVELGMAHKLGKPIIDGIVQHHGTTLISYFYNKALDQKSEEDPEFSEDEFRYPGPKPQFREAALCMLADSIEAAARSLDEPTPTRLQNIVKNIIQRKLTDGQLEECDITLKDLAKIENAFIRILLGIYHQRIDYPKSAGGGLGDVS